MWQVKRINSVEEDVLHLTTDEVIKHLKSKNLSSNSVVWDVQTDSWVKLKVHYKFAKLFAKQSSRNPAPNPVLAHFANVKEFFHGNALIKSVFASFLVIFAVSLLLASGYYEYIAIKTTIDYGVFFTLVAGMLSVYPVCTMIVISCLEANEIFRMTDQKYIVANIFSRVVRIYTTGYAFICLFLLPATATYLFEMSIRQILPFESALQITLKYAGILLASAFGALLLGRLLTECWTVLFNMAEDLSVVRKVQEEKE